MKKIGIITHYYGSRNIGGLLQSYAMCVALSKLEVKAEQICYRPVLEDPKIRVLAVRLKVEQILHCPPKQLVKKITEKILKIKKETNAKEQRKIDLQWKRFKEFEKIIPHSQDIYTDTTLTKVNEIYDAFVCGSDVIWHPGNLMHPAYYLQFADKNKLKISYAASMGRLPETVTEKKEFSNNIRNISYISVRERSTADYLKKTEDIDARVVLDPTLLLDAEEWMTLEKVEVVPKDPYVFCYFLGENEKSRENAVEFCKKRNLQMIYLPYIMGYARKADIALNQYGNGIYNYGPEDVVALIHHAEYVFTESFHAVVFSTIYNKKFFAFDRDERNSTYSINARINDFLKEYELQDHYVGNGTVPSEEEDNTLELRSAVQEKLEKSRLESYAFLKRTLL